MPYLTLLKQAHAVMHGAGSANSSGTGGPRQCNTWLVASDEVEFEEAAAQYGEQHSIHTVRFNTTDQCRRNSTTCSSLHYGRKRNNYHKVRPVAFRVLCMGHTCVQR